jgi:HlyD family secretion protein
MRKGIIGLTLLVVVAGLSAALYSRTRNANDSGFATVAVARGPIVEKALAVGAIRPKKEIAIKSKISGIVLKAFVEMGDTVRAGDPLFEIIPDPTPIELTEARREVEIARNVYDNALLQFDRQTKLRDQGIVSDREYEQANRDVGDAQIRLQLAEERLALTEKGKVSSAELTVESVIRAPITGTILELLVNEGDPVVPLTSFQAGTPLATAAEMSELMFKGTVDEIDVGKLHEGMPARIQIGALPEAEVEGTVYKIAPKSKTEEGATLFDIEIELTPSETVLRAGYSANADIVVREQSATLFIPERLVSFEDGEAWVEVPGPAAGAEPERRKIEIGLSDGINVEIVAGLNENDLVVERPPKVIE